MQAQGGPGGGRDPGACGPPVDAGPCTPCPPGRGSARSVTQTVPLRPERPPGKTGACTARHSAPVCPVWLWVSRLGTHLGTDVLPQTRFQTRVIRRAKLEPVRTKASLPPPLRKPRSRPSAAGPALCQAGRVRTDGPHLPGDLTIRAGTDAKP